MRNIILTAIFALFAATASAQLPTVTNYELNVYNIGAQSPLTSYTFDASEASCTGTSVQPPTGLVVNPSAIGWDDDLGQGCTHVMTVLPSWPIPGEYVSRLIACNDADCSAESGDSNNFFTLDPPTAPTNLGVVQ